MRPRYIRIHTSHSRNIQAIRNLIGFALIITLYSLIYCLPVYLRLPFTP